MTREPYMSKKYYNYSFTWFDYPESHREILKAFYEGGNIKYLAASEATCEKTGKPYVQGVIRFSRQFHIRAAFKRITRIGGVVCPTLSDLHARENRERCLSLCEGDKQRFMEFGDVPKYATIKTYGSAMPRSDPTKATTVINRKTVITYGSGTPYKDFTKVSATTATEAKQILAPSQAQWTEIRLWAKSGQFDKIEEKYFPTWLEYEDKLRKQYKPDLAAAATASTNEQSTSATLTE